MPHRIRVYTASKLSEAPRWRRLAKEWPEVKFVARWPFKHVDNIPDLPPFLKICWEHDLTDVTASDVVLIYAEADHKLRGAIVEVGMAIALGRPVIAVGAHPDYSSWQYHALVHRVPDLDAARLLLFAMAL